MGFYNGFVRCFVVLVCAVLGLTSLAEEKSQRFEFAETEMGLPFRIVLYAKDSATAQHASDAAFARIKQLNDILSD